MLILFCFTVVIVIVLGYVGWCSQFILGSALHGVWEIKYSLVACIASVLPTVLSVTLAPDEFPYWTFLVYRGPKYAEL